MSRSPARTDRRTTPPGAVPRESRTSLPGERIASTDQPTLEDFGNDVWWIVLIKIVGVFVVLVVMTLFAIVFERKVVARMQSGSARTGSARAATCRASPTG